MVQAAPGRLPYPVRVPTTDPLRPSAPADDSPALSSVRSVPYKGAALDAQKGPGLGCFRFQLILLVVLLFATPLSVTAGAPDWFSAALLFVTIALLLVAGQTIIFLLRLIAADRRGRRRPLAGASPTVGQIEDREATTEPAAGASPETDPDVRSDSDLRPDDRGMRQ